MEQDLKYFVRCDDCGEYTYIYDHKVTHGFYGRGLCNPCELKVIEAGFWSREKIMQCLLDRENHKHE